jgi:hypothetical protein
VNKHRPNVYADEEGKMEMFLDREEVGENMVGDGLEVTIDWVEGVCGEGGGNDPLVVWLVNVLVDAWMVFQSVNPVNAVIGEDEEPRSQIWIQKRSEKREKSAYAGIERKNQAQPCSSTLSYSLEYPRTSPSNQGSVKSIITGKLCRLIAISCRT